MDLANHGCACRCQVDRLGWEIVELNFRCCDVCHFAGCECAGFSMLDVGMRLYIPFVDTALSMVGLTLGDCLI